MLLINIFSKTILDANALSTKKVVDTGIPKRVKRRSIAGAAA